MKENDLDLPVHKGIKEDQNLCSLYLAKVFITFDENLFAVRTCSAVEFYMYLSYFYSVIFKQNDYARIFLFLQKIN